MADYTNITSAKHATLVANAQDSITFTANWPAVLIYNNDSSQPLYVLIDPGATNVTVAGADTLIVPPKSARVFNSSATGATVVKLICSAAAGYTVEALTENRLNL